jgi:peptidoglycan-associated lipoprotein
MENTMTRTSARSLARTGAALALAALLGACSSAVKLDETPVESRTPVPVAGGGAAGGAGAGGKAAPVPQSQVATVSVAQAAAAAALAAGRVVFFDFDSFVVRDDARPVVDAHAKALVADKARRLTVEGHTDERGGREYNLALGQKRAEAVVKAMTLLGAADGQLEAVSFGKERPAVQGSDEASWAKNRRAELKDKS